MPPEPLPASTNRRGWSETWRIGLTALMTLGAWTSLATVPGVGSHGGRVLLDAVLGVVALVVVHWRRSNPLLVLLVTCGLGAVSAAASGSALLALFSVAARRNPALLAVAVVLNVVSGVTAEYVVGTHVATTWWGTVLIVASSVAIVAAVGYAVGARRAVECAQAALVASWRERAETAEREQASRVAGAQANERTRIAREMHDVLAHRISLVAMHASALTYRTDLTAQEQHTAAHTISANAQQALKDLRDVLGVLRSTDAADLAAGGCVVQNPQPVLADVQGLVADARAAGEHIELHHDVTGEPPATSGRTAYRVIQEGLTNARKHAQGAKVTMFVTGAPGASLWVEVVTARSRLQGSPLPGAGLGLVGLRERVELAGGRLVHGPTPSGSFRLAAELPWIAEEEAS